MSEDLTLKNLTIEGTLTIKPEGNARAIVIRQSTPDHYPMIEFQTPEGEFMCAVVSHQTTHEGDTHNHVSIYVADPSQPNGRRSKVDLQWGKELSTLSLEGIALLVKDQMSQFVIRGEDGKFYQLGIDVEGKLTITLVTNIDRKKLLAPGVVVT